MRPSRFKDQFSVLFSKFPQINLVAFGTENFENTRAWKWIFNFARPHAVTPLHIHSRLKMMVKNKQTNKIIVLIKKSRIARFLRFYLKSDDITTNNTEPEIGSKWGRSQWSGFHCKRLSGLCLKHDFPAGCYSPVKLSLWLKEIENSLFLVGLFVSARSYIIKVKRIFSCENKKKRKKKKKKKKTRLYFVYQCHLQRFFFFIYIFLYFKSTICEYMIAKRISFLTFKYFPC